MSNGFDDRRPALDAQDTSSVRAPATPRFPLEMPIDSRPPPPPPDPSAPFTHLRLAPGSNFVPLRD